MYQWIFFDWDGCIADSLDDWVTVCRRSLLRQGIDALPSVIWDKLCIGDIPKQFAVKDYEGCKKDIGIIGEEVFGNVKLYEGAAQMLQDLAAVKSLALITNNRTKLIRQPLVRHDLSQYFDMIITQESNVRPKPHPAGIQKALDFFDALPGRAVMVGDSTKDLEAARRAGIDSILFYPPAHRHRYYLNTLLRERPTHIVESHTELTLLLTS